MYLGRYLLNPLIWSLRITASLAILGPRSSNEQTKIQSTLRMKTGVANITTSVTQPVHMKESTSDGLFSTHILRGYKFIDKTKFIVMLLEGDHSPGHGTAGAVAFYRPRGCGKSFNLDMFHEFLRSDRQLNVFKDGMYIMKAEYDDIRNKYMKKTPVIFTDFTQLSDAKTFTEAKVKLHNILRSLFEKHKYLLDSDQVPSSDRTFFRKFLERRDSHEDDINALLVLSEMVTHHHGRKPFILIDEVDSSVAGATLFGYLNEMEHFLARFFSNSLKYNRAYEKAILAGVIPIGSYLPNNVEQYTIYDKKFNDMFGLTMTEIEENLLTSSQKRNKKFLKMISDWYNHLTIGTLQIFNPASVIESYRNNWEYVTSRAVRGSLHVLTEHLLKNMGLFPPLNLQILMAGNSLKKSVCYFVTFRQLFYSEAYLWAYFMHAGIVASDEVPSGGNEFSISIKIPGREMRDVLHQKFNEIGYRLPDYERLSRLIEEENIKEINETVCAYVVNAGPYLSIRQNYVYGKDRLVAYLDLLWIDWTKHHGGRVVTEPTSAGIVLTFYKNSTKLPFKIKLTQSRWEKFVSTLKREKTMTEFGDVTMTLAVPKLGALFGWLIG